ncbi:putative ripening-related protein 2 [Vitis vinifera]|uniref:Putative ripening-related protein 2 n=1 Tax=Vitis vinifera TaxID=29760 RepID=A0A438HJ23_VITVI|nr:putative ripening-related protein 2 [Vitis vinifera]
MKTFGLKASLLLIAILVFTDCLNVGGQVCHPSGKIRGKKPPPGECNQGNDSDCCKEGKLYTTYKCSPTVSSHTKAYLTLNGFEKDEDGGAPSECDNHYHSDDTPVLALSTGCDHDYQPPCANNIVDASRAVWKALGVPQDQWGGLDITWTDA